MIHFHMHLLFQPNKSPERSQEAPVSLTVLCLCTSHFIVFECHLFLPVCDGLLLSPSVRSTSNLFREAFLPSLHSQTTLILLELGYFSSLPPRVSFIYLSTPCLVPILQLCTLECRVYVSKPEK